MTTSGVGTVRPGDQLGGEAEDVGRVVLHIGPAEG